MLAPVVGMLAFGHGARPLSPPSAPPSSVQTHLQPLRLTPNIEYHYEWKPGFIGAGGDVALPANTTVKEALARCSALARCRGITYDGSNTTTAPVRAYFKLSADAGGGAKSNWSTWAKVANVTPPAATLPVGGTSRLELLLRQGFFSVQNLSRVGETWSFTRPLDAKTTLPQCAHLGDLTLRLRPAGSALPYSAYTTTLLGAPAKPLPPSEVRAASAGGQVLAAQDISQLLASSADPGAPPLPLRATRSYERSEDGAALLVRFTLSSTSAAPLELGALGFAMPESPGHPPAGIETVTWADPHVGDEHGFVEFVRVVDDEATLLATPLDAGTPLEAWRPMMEDLGGGDAYEWVAASAAWAEEWANSTQSPFLNLSDYLRHSYPAFAVSPKTPWPSADGKSGVPLHAQAASSGGGSAAPWNPPRSLSLQPGATVSFGVRLQLAEGGPRTRNAALSAAGEPVLRAVPGYVLPAAAAGAAGDAGARLFVSPPAGATTLSAACEPYPAISARLSLARLTGSDAPPPGYDGFSVVASGHGRARVRVLFSDNTSAVAHYFVTPRFAEQVALLGSHWADTSWLPREFPDPFGRSASVMPWDRSSCGTAPCGHVLNDARAYDVGLSDDAGGGNPLGFASKVRAAPTAHEVARVDEYIHSTLYGVKPDVAKPPYKSLQIREGEEGDVDGIRMTMFYYDVNISNSSSGHFAWNYSEADKCAEPFGGPTWCMTENMANATYRGFNYPHQIASYWAMYHVARHTTLPTKAAWQWYLWRAGRTALKLGTAGVGFMDGTVAREVLEALLVEGKAGNATFAELGKNLSANMKARQLHWAATPYPYDGGRFHIMARRG